MTYLPTRTGNPAIDRNLRDIADALAAIAAGTGTTVSIGGSSTVVTGGTAIVNYGIESGVGAAGVTVTFATAFTGTGYVPAVVGATATEDVGVTVEKLSATQMKLTPIGRTGVTISWSAIGS